MQIIKLQEKQQEKQQEIKHVKMIEKLLVNNKDNRKAQRRNPVAPISSLSNVWCAWFGGGDQVLTGGYLTPRYQLAFDQSDFTFSTYFNMWKLPPGVSGLNGKWPGIMGFGNSSTDRFWIQIITVSQIRIGVNGTIQVWDIDTQIRQWKWVHMIATLSNNKVTLWINGVNQGRKSVPSSPTSPGALQLGELPTHGGAFASGNTFYGLLDEVAIFDYAFTDSTATTVFNGGNPGDLTTLNPYAWYRFGDGNSAVSITGSEVGTHTELRVVGPTHGQPQLTDGGVQKID